MTTINLWAIRHIPTGNYLPEPTGRLQRGGSWVEPEPADATRARLFPSFIGARNALSQWLRGKFANESGYDIYSLEYWEETDIIPVLSRKKEEIEIIKLEVHLP